MYVYKCVNGSSSSFSHMAPPANDQLPPTIPPLLYYILYVGLLYSFTYRSLYSSVHRKKQCTANLNVNISALGPLAPAHVKHHKYQPNLFNNTLISLFP